MLFEISKQQINRETSGVAQMASKALVQALLANDYPFVLAHKETYALHLYDEATIGESNLDDYFIDCKMTGQTIVDYVDGEVIFETPKER